ncbi:dockerin type I domain-containing protein [Lacipirellula parvula]|uniref:Dockerin domain-containing protein n=1 Tax=Lacipirellula parvula TaxID=2650471 RepID=A0A5K7X899_9BACT|nr:dockerin type I domain-containing protein [Lacipirellula parvula]BBO32778.1 hypothetical protein PLANPX_2390 [Lacipirellula parvula]
MFYEVTPTKVTFACVAVATTLFGIAPVCLGQTLYTESFDSPLPSGAWSINAGGGTDKHADFFFDYSAVGIPVAPNSTGGTTRGMKLQANLTSGVAGGINVSPVGKSFTGDYALRFDLWSNFIGAEVGAATSANTDGIWEGGASSTKLSNYGILSSGVGDNYQTATRAGVAEALYFSNTGDGQAGFDYRIQGPGADADHGPSGFRATVEVSSATPANNYDPVLDAGVNFADIYPEGHPDAGLSNRGVFLDPDVPLDLNDSNVTDGFLYQSAFPSVAAPGQAALFPATQFDTTMPGAMGMHWREVEIKKVGNLVTWSVLNAGANSNQTFVLATVDLALLKVPATSGTNIMFGESDPSANIGSDPDFAALQFTLIDNVRVVRVAAPADSDFNDDGIVNGADFLIWQRNFGGAGTPTTGDANSDGIVDAGDLSLWKSHFGGAPSLQVATVVPEPACLFLALSGAAIFAFRKSAA